MRASRDMWISGTVLVPLLGLPVWNSERMKFAKYADKTNVNIVALGRQLSRRHFDSSHSEFDSSHSRPDALTRSALSILENGEASTHVHKLKYLFSVLRLP